MDGNRGPGCPPFLPIHGAIVHFSTSWLRRPSKKALRGRFEGPRFSTASALRASAGRRKTPRSRGPRLFSTLMWLLYTIHAYTWSPRSKRSASTP